MARGSGQNREKVRSASPPTMPDPAAPSKAVEAHEAYRLEQRQQQVPLLDVARPDRHEDCLTTCR